MKKVLRIISAIMLSIPFLFMVKTAANAEEKENIVDYAKKFIGAPYKWGGTTPKGFDCSGFIIYVFKEYNVQLPRKSADQFNQGESVDRNSLVPGDLVFFNTNNKGVSHVGMYIGDNEFIHASSSKGVTISNLGMSYYKTRYIGAKRYFNNEQVKSAFAATPVKSGQIGTVYVKKKINLWQRDDENGLIFVRVLNPGEKYRVYHFDNLYGGQYNLGSKLYITNMPDHIDYIPIAQ
ncbi:NLP/P60 protein [Bacillus methanolicus PB1]|uniref:NLP/P60 protein n=1 Tax=Bacillus methanolicus PB1 TaxID=997296 RepID=I3E1V9_BACMT|nr:C40 family peptidase [Bacillus methanolicus]EIJ80480.1 NLP/P60 protein [Bacillus methanolicus PB1]